MNILVIDIGTSSMRGILYRDNIEKIAAHQIKYRPVCRCDGRLEQEAAEFDEVCLRIVSAIQKDTKEDIHVVTLTSQRSSIIPVNEQGEPLMPLIMWQDTRNKDICEKLKTKDDVIATLSGSRVNTVFSGAKMAWVKQECPEIYAKTRKFVNIPEYLIHRMTGEYVLDYTYGSRSNLMNLRTCEWDKELLDIFGIEQSFLSKLVPPGSICGYITAKYAEKSGLKEGTPVISAGGDQQCAAIGQGAFTEGNLSIVSGTGAFMVAACSKVPEHLSKDIICNCSAVSGQYIVETNVLSCCSAFDWFLRNFYDGDEIDYEKINRDLENLDDIEEKCIALPYFQGRSTPVWNAQAMATFHNITLGTTRTGMLKALVEGIFMEICNNIEMLRSYTDIQSAAISGGMTNSTVMNQMQADIYGIPLVHREDAESTAIGAYMVTAVSLGLYGNYEEIYQKVEGNNKSRQYKSRKEKQEYYKQKREKMNRLYEKIY